MNKIVMSFVVLLLCACVCFGAQQAANDAPQQFTVLRAGRLIAPSETLTNTDAHCAITGAGSAATMQCHPAAVTLKTSYHYNTALIVDAKGTGYVIACRAALITNLWCKKADSGTTITGHFENGHLSITDGQKSHDYDVLTSASVGALPVTQPAPQPTTTESKAKNQPKPVPAPPQPVASAPAAASKKPADAQEKPGSDTSTACMSPTAACVSFVSEPQGADIYVDGKFVGNTPSTLTLMPGSHEIRIESAKLKPWTRTLETTAGSKITVRATLEP